MTSMTMAKSQVSSRRSGAPCPRRDTAKEAQLDKCSPLADTFEGTEIMCPKLGAQRGSKGLKGAHKGLTRGSKQRTPSSEMEILSILGR